MLKIGFCGAHGTGKTTLAKHLSQILKLPLITGLMRSFWTNNGVYDFEKLPPRIRYEFQLLSLQKQIDEESKHQSFVTDRTAIDQIAYFVESAQYSDQELNSYIQKCKSSIDNYTHLFFVPIEFDFEPEELRAKASSRTNVQNNIQKYSQQFASGKVFEVTGNVDQRISKILNILQPPSS
jgi:energy-coupling factor transporter ATP-binding protein EcfA2